MTIVNQGIDFGHTSAEVPQGAEPTPISNIQQLLDLLNVLSNFT
jgi:hypothetical protein